MRISSTTRNHRTGIRSTILHKILNYSNNFPTRNRHRSTIVINNRVTINDTINRPLFNLLRNISYNSNRRLLISFNMNHIIQNQFHFPNRHICRNTNAIHLLPANIFSSNRQRQLRFMYFNRPTRRSIRRNHRRGQRRNRPRRHQPIARIHFRYSRGYNPRSISLLEGSPRSPLIATPLKRKDRIVYLPARKDVIDPSILYQQIQKAHHQK